MRETRTLLTTLLLLPVLPAVLLSAGCSKAASAPPAAAPPTVSVVSVAPEPVTLTTELPGRTSAYLVAEVRPQVSGLVTRRAFTEGATVSAGSLLYQIDPAPYRAAYEQAAAAQEVAAARVPALRSRAERMRQLAGTRAVGQQDADDAEAALLQAEAAVLAAEAAATSARINLDYTPVKAPITGRIGRSAVTVGALVTAMQPAPLATIQQLDPIYVDVTQASADLLRLRRQAGSGELTRGGATSRSVRLLLEDGTPYPLAGRLEFQDVSVDPSTGSVTVRMVFPNPDQVLLPGMYVRAVLEEGVQERAILAPQQGVMRDPTGAAYALVVGADDTVEQRPLEVGRAIGDRWLVTSGLAEGDRLIVEGLQRVRPGMAVTAVPFAAPSTPETPTEADAPVIVEAE